MEASGGEVRPWMDRRNGRSHVGSPPPEGACNDADRRRRRRASHHHHGSVKVTSCSVPGPWALTKARRAGCRTAQNGRMGLRKGGQKTITLLPCWVWLADGGLLLGPGLGFELGRPRGEWPPASTPLR